MVKGHNSEHILHVQGRTSLYSALILQFKNKNTAKPWNQRATKLSESLPMKIFFSFFHFPEFQVDTIWIFKCFLRKVLRATSHCRSPGSNLELLQTGMRALRWHKTWWGAISELYNSERQNWLALLQQITIHTCFKWLQKKKAVSYLISPRKDAAATKSANQLHLRNWFWLYTLTCGRKSTYDSLIKVTFYKISH